MGKIRVYTGTMFAGKTTKLINLVENLRLNGNRNYSVYRPVVNTVDGKGVVLTHNNFALQAESLRDDTKILINDPHKYIFIDSFQNLKPIFVDVIEELAVEDDKEFYLFGTRTKQNGEFQENRSITLQRNNDRSSTHHSFC